MTVTTKKTTINGGSWTQTYHDLIRNGHILGTAFDKDDGTVNYEPETGRSRIFHHWKKLSKQLQRLKSGFSSR